jgi:hypothetical protein
MGRNLSSLNQEEEDIFPFVCSQCGAEIIPEVEPWPEICQSCQRVFDQKAQLAFCRGQDAFTAGQALILPISPGTREKNLTTEDEMEGVRYYIQAYTALQESFHGEIAESQRQLGIEMMAAMARVFMQHGMVSQLESGYWSNLLLEQNSVNERAELLVKLAAKERGGVIGMIQRWRWRARAHQLEKALIDLDAKILKFERHIAFVDPPDARRIKKPR